MASYLSSPQLTRAIESLLDFRHFDLQKLAALAVLLLVAYYAGVVYFFPRSKLPPGPSPTPFLGHIFQVPTEKSWLYFNKLCKTYGPIVRLSLGGTDLVVLNNLEDIEELLAKRSQNYSSRARQIYAAKYRSADRRLVLLPYGPLLKRQRAAMFQMLNPKGKEYMNIKWFTSEAMFSLVYGKKFDGSGGESGDELRKVLHILEVLARDFHPRAHLVDAIPALDWLPDALAPWRQEAKAMHEFEYGFYKKLLYDVKLRLDAGEDVECFAARLWEQQDKMGLDEVSMAYVAGSAFEAGTDNTAATILWSLVAVLNHPEAIKKIQAELDRVLGPEGLVPPTFAHLEQMPYTVAFTKEAFRWMPVAPLSAPHSNLKGDTYKGYDIAPGTTVIPNIWAVHHNADMFPDPFKFQPERYMPKDGETLKSESLNEGHWGFGFGRRVCPGQYLAARMVWIGIVTIYWAFDIAPPVDANGNEILPDPTAVRNGLTAEPDLFDVRLTPRSKTHMQTILQSSSA